MQSKFFNFIIRLSFQDKIQPLTEVQLTNKVLDSQRSEEQIVDLAARRAIIDSLELNEEWELEAFIELQAKMKMFNKAIPELRVKLPIERLTDRPYLSLNLQVCVDRYFACGKLLFVGNADRMVVDFLLSFYEEHPIEWQVSGWKNNAIADLMERDRNTAELWLKKYWTIRQRVEAKLANQYSDTRSAAQSAVLELEILDSADTNPIFLIPGRVQLTAFVNWLNQNYDRLAQTKKGEALAALAAEEFRRKYRKSKLSDRDFEDFCTAYSELEGFYKGTVPPSQAILTVIAARHDVSPRLVSEERSILNRRRNSSLTTQKAHK